MQGPNQQMVKEPETRVPRKASGFAADLWSQSVWERVQLLINPSPETAKTFMRAGLESFDLADLRLYISTQRDVIPLLREWMQLDHDLVRPWAQSIIRIWWPQIFEAAMNPAQMLADIARDDPAKGALLATKEGRDWFNATIFNLISFFRGYARIEGDGVVQPPPNFPEKLRMKALGGGSRILRKIQHPQK